MTTNTPGANRSTLDRGSVFAASSPFVLFDYFRVPYTSVPDHEGAGPGAPPVETIRSSIDASRSLHWIPEAGRASYRGVFEFDSVSVLGGLSHADDVKAALAGLGGRWEPSEAVSDPAGREVAAIWRDGNGRTLLPFDPNALIEAYWNESNLALVGSGLTRDARTAARRAYYRLRPLMPRSVQLAFRRLYSRAQSNGFPRWPIESSLHDLYEYLFRSAARLVERPVPFLAPWPSGYEWALVLSHDVETANGYGKIQLLRGIEAEGRYRSAWYFVPKNHAVETNGVFDELRKAGCEIGVHGLYHDGRDIVKIHERLPMIEQYAREWGAVGFRSPATLRDWQAMAKLPFEYDSSYSDTAPYEPQPGGCASLLPYMIDDVVELPITLPQDHTLFEILGEADERLWRTKAQFIRERGGMAMVLTHPDYAGNEVLRAAYRELLGDFANDETAWKALPREVSDWWRQRSASSLSRDGDTWSVIGPAAERARIGFVEPAVEAGS